MCQALMRFPGSFQVEPDGETDNFAPDYGGLRRDPASLPTNVFPADDDLDSLQDGY